MNPVELKYNKNHEYAKVEGDIVTFGITDHAQESLGDVVFVELPDEGSMVTVGESYGTVESVKAVSDISASISGKIVEVNTLVLDAPDLLNSDPYGQGWLIKVAADDLSPLENMMTAAEYETFLLEEEH
ncbi:glycine cleavage system protein GcvH [Desulfosporosinus sp. BG]|uniref:glycine cleavage system protein GcvH n=1 Tax=Desulfosporosinus sp. BG TaxID=1633135 RepID=UPI00083AEB36|nr:glycine cleavage system protein GcvH [Desulfosporosinus sp. BG]ODA39573.1 Glycine cleavage system H protein [Desulfosporosinus sp. BG]